MGNHAGAGSEFKHRQSASRIDDRRHAPRHDLPGRPNGADGFGLAFQTGQKSDFIREMVAELSNQIVQGRGSFRRYVLPLPVQHRRREGKAFMLRFQQAKALMTLLPKSFEKVFHA